MNEPDTQPGSDRDAADDACESGRTDDAVGPSTQRLIAMDVLRGIAVLGILLMNVQSFAMPDMAYMNPAYWGDFTGINFAVWLAKHVLIDQKFITLFSLLFGAGIIMIAQRRQQQDRSPTATHYRRMGWLLVLGLAHAYLIWYGDILTTYAICGMIAFLAWPWRAGTQLAAGIALYVLALLMLPAFMFALSLLVPDDTAIWSADAKAVTGDLYWQQEVYQGDWPQQMKHRVPMALTMHLFYLPLFFGPLTLGVMLIGMALYRWGVLTGQASTQTYSTLLAAGLAIGLPTIGLGVHLQYRDGWGMWTTQYAFLFNAAAAIPMALAWASLVMLWVRHSRGSWLIAALGATGRMALSNYLAQSLICMGIFYGGIGLGLFGDVPRIGQLAIVLAIWPVLIGFSVLWMRCFRFGPVEWLWRWLTYAQRPALRKHHD